MESAGLSPEEANASVGVLKKNGWISAEKGEETLFEISEKGKEKIKEGFEEEGFLQRRFPVSCSSLTEEDASIVKFFDKRKMVS